MTDKRFLIIADDFTGANDTGVQIKKHGLAASVLLKTDDLSQTQGSVVLDTESRVISAEDAYARVKEALQAALKEGEYEFLYKKVDSTLRGNIIAEVKAMVEVCQPELVVFAPAFPKAIATLRPIPREAPVTIATFPSKSILINLLEIIKVFF